MRVDRLQHSVLSLSLVLTSSYYSKTPMVGSSSHAKLHFHPLLVLFFTNVYKLAYYCHRQCELCTLGVKFSYVSCQTDLEDSSRLHKESEHNLMWKTADARYCCDYYCLSNFIGPLVCNILSYCTGGYCTAWVIMDTRLY